jgi:leukotriene-A4 hydrolase
MKLSTSSNAYVRSAWLVLAIGNRYQPAIPSAEEFLPRVGRNLLIRPVYRALVAQGEWGKPIAERIFASARGNYHPVTVSAIERVLNPAA